MASEDRVNVLLVDDEPRSLVAVAALLAQPGVRVVTAKSGDEALRRLLDEDFAVILLDVQMPGLDGFETAELIRSRDRSRLTPILFLTAYGRADAEIIRGYSVGAVDYVFKPVVPEILKSKVSVFLELHRKTQALQQQNAEIDRARAQAQLESQFKSKFLASMSHELRTPLNGIIGFSELLEQQLVGPLAPRQLEYIRHVLQSGRHLLALVNDILDLSRIEAGRMDLVRERVPLAVIVDAAWGTVQPLAAKRDIRVEIEIQPGLPDLYVDALRIRQVLYNLLSNGIKFTPPGGRVGLRAEGDLGVVRIAVSDTGIGIRPEHMARLFREFERIETEEHERQEGTGLGLALTRRLVELHGGTIVVESAPGQGSVFTVTLPDLAPAAPAVDPENEGIVAVERS